MTAASPPGWFPDHDDPTLLRYWDGTGWNGDTAAARQTRSKRDHAGPSAREGSS